MSAHVRDFWRELIALESIHFVSPGVNVRRVNTVRGVRLIRTTDQPFQICFLDF